MSSPLLSIIIPTHNRPQLVQRAVQSALEQTAKEIEVIVVDDASTEPVILPSQSNLKLIRLQPGRGGAGARNVGTEAAQGRWVTYLDDDDRLLPHMASVSLQALLTTTFSPPIAIISGIEVINTQGKVLRVRTPPSVRLKGCHFALEDLEPQYSYNTKQTMVVERAIIQKIGGWDETFRSRVHSELFLRLNSACSILGLPIVTYQLYSHDADRVSRNGILRQESFRRLITKHQTAFRAHPKRFASFILEHAHSSYRMGQKQAAISSLLWALRIHPQQTLAQSFSILRHSAYSMFL
ncbi:MAG: glycosyltransferase [Timaviella obliquedivisa GSE-PSE-MK23-08B]|jgi:glycosyltransferase involved in cell wall biosynthesis|nr:glycosyltransferase [Timaviella obliquedivisa GSE-PSE-MK23-08B]